MNVMQLLLKRYKRKVNKVIKGGDVFPILLALIISLIIPPFNISADDYSGSTIQGFNVSLIDVEQVLVSSGGTSGYMGKYIYEVEFILDDSYVGYINVSGEIKFYPYNSSTISTYNLPGRNYFVNGSSFKLTFQLTGDGYTADNRPSLNNTVFTYGNHNLYKHSEIDSLETIIDILTDLYNNTDTVEGLLNSQLTQLQLIAQRCNITNQYLDTITQLRNWNIPIESYIPINYIINQSGSSIVDWIDNNYFNYPIVKVDNTVQLFRIFSNQGDTLVGIIGLSSQYQNAQLFINDFEVYGSSTGLMSASDFSSFKTIYRTNSTSPISVSEIVKFTIPYTTGQSIYIIPKSTQKIIPIYFNTINNKNITTDFALLYGLSNELLDNINIIANGTIQSNQSSSDLENQTTSFDTTSNSLYMSENAFNTDMNNKLQNIDTSFNPSTSFGSKFLSSADWVRTQFNNLTSTSPFGTVLSFSMLLGLSLLIIGKVFK